MSSEQFDELATLLREIDDLEAVARILDWDQQTHMPKGGALARGRQMALVGRLAHERRRSDAMRRLVEVNRPLAEYQPTGTEASAQEVSDATYRAAMVRLALREHRRAVSEPPELVEETATHMASSFVAWTGAREDGDFSTMVPYLEKTLELSRKLSACHASYDEPADAFIDRADPGMTSAAVRTLFGVLKAQLVPLVRELASQGADDGRLVGDFDVERQIAFASELVRRLGYDFERGRRDETFHPFMTRFSGGDVRITTSFHRGGIARGLFGAIHEAGHALYEQNIDPRFDGGPIGHGVSAGVHESQSRLWENLVGRSMAFWEYYYPELARVFPETYAAVSGETFYRAINRVVPSAIRVEADEVTYNLHVMLRFELEQELWRGELAVKDLGEAFRARLSRDLGVQIASDRDGVLQDVHWYVEPVGGSFQGYTLGNLMSAQFFAAASRALPNLEDNFRNGDFSQLLAWLTKTVYRTGALEEPSQLLQRATGEALSVTPYVDYLKRKYGGLSGAASV